MAEEIQADTTHTATLEASLALRLKRSREEVIELFRAAREEVRQANPTGRNLLEELLAERRAAAGHE